MLEKTIENRLRMRVKSMGGIALKLTSPNYDGLPDRLVLLPGGKIYFVELKQKGKRPTPRQQKVHEMLRSLGFEVLVIDSKEAVNGFMEAVT